MALGLIYFAVSVVAVLTLVAFGYFVYIKYKSREEPENQPLLENYMPQYSEGSVLGVVSDLKLSETRAKISFYPRDIDYIKLQKEKTKIKEYTIFCDKAQIQFFPKGAFSQHRDLIKIYPSNPDMLPETIKNTPQGKVIMKMIEENNQVKDQTELNQIRMESLKRFAKETYGGGIFEDYGHKTKKVIEGIDKLVNREEKKKDEK